MPLNSELLWLYTYDLCGVDEYCRLKLEMKENYFKTNEMKTAHVMPLAVPQQAIKGDTGWDRKLVNLETRAIAILPQSDKRKQLFKMTFLVNEQNVSVMYIDINAVSWCLDLNIFQQDECFCSKLRLEVHEIEHAKSNIKTSPFHIWVFCNLVPFVIVGQHNWDVKQNESDDKISSTCTPLLHILYNIFKFLAVTINVKLGYISVLCT